MFSTVQQFQEFKSSFITNNKMPGAFVVGIPFYDDEGAIIATKFLTTNGPGQNQGFMAVVMKVLDISGFPTAVTLTIDYDKWQEMRGYFNPFHGQPGHANYEAFEGMTRVEKRIMVIYPSVEYLEKEPSIDTSDVNGRLALISGLHFRPNTINLDNIFSLLPNLYFTNCGAYTEEQWRKMRIGFDRKNAYGILETLVSMDKFPPLWWAMPIPKGVRIADPSRVRFGAYLSPGTTVMHEGFVNFNAGTLGPCMIEGRISAGVVVGADSDLGGGASIAGTLSGGGKEKITIGENCLIGANAGTGISLGNRCTIEAGLYITPGTKVSVVSKEFSSRKVPYCVKAKELSGKPDMLFIRNSMTGKVELRFNTKPNKLNEVLHTLNAKK